MNFGRTVRKLKFICFQTARNIHTSPAVISLERVMAGFRARSQLLVSRLEDSDDVCLPEFSDGSDSQPEDPSPQPYA